MSYRFAAPSQVFSNLAGTAPIPDGYWSFFEPLATTTPKDTYSDPELTIENSHPVLLDSSARLDTEVWLDGDYFAELHDADDVLVWDGVITSGQDAATVLEALGLNEIWVGDGAGNAVATPFVPLPDPTGSADYMLITDGVNWLLQPQPEEQVIPEPEVVITAVSVLTGVRVGTSDEETKFYAQFGSDSASASSTKTTTKAVTFPVAFSTVPKVFVSNKTGYVNGGDTQPTVSAINPTTTGFTAQFSTQLGEGNSDSDITVAIDFDYAAFGTLEVPA